MTRVLGALGLIFGTSVTLLLPGVAGYSGLVSVASIVQTEAEGLGRQITEMINNNPDLWKLETVRLGELLRQRSADHTPEARAVFDLQGVLVAESRDPLPSPLLERRSLLYDAGVAVGSLRVQRSLRPLLVHMALLSVLGVLLGGTAYVMVRVLPLRALRRAQERLVHEATHDALTGLPNRALFRDRLQQAMERARRTGRPMALMFLDLDNFKDINDSMGHDAGDEVLRHVAAVLEQGLSGAGGPARRGLDGAHTVARLGGDEFTAIVESAGSVEDTAALAQRILHDLQRPLPVLGRELVLSGSIGISVYPQDGAGPDLLLRQADMAMYRAKDRGRNTHQFFNDELNRAVQQRIALEYSLRGALDRGEFVLHYQAKASLATGQVDGVEALLRWQRPGEGLVPPDRFIRALEDSPLIVPAGAWVIEAACAQLVAWDRQGLGGLSMAVNVSARQFREPGLPHQIAAVLQRHGLAAARLELELTETLLMEDSELSRNVLNGLATVGVRVAIDDFGTGHSSLAYLKRFNVDTLKIDRSFVRDVPHDADNAAIATAVVALAHSLKLQVISEGVETAEQLAFVRALGCELLQGYLLAQPMAADVFADWLARYRAGDAALHAWYGAPEALARQPADPGSCACP